MMKILHYIPSIDESSGGVGAYMQLLARDLGKLCELHIVTHRSERMLEMENCELHFIPLNKNPFTNKSKREFLQLLDELQPDVFHTNCCWMPQSARTAIWAKRAGYKVVYTPHGMLEPWIMQRHYWTKKLPALLLFQKKGLHVADVIHATAESEKKNLMRYVNGNVNVNETLRYETRSYETLRYETRSYETLRYENENQNQNQNENQNERVVVIPNCVRVDEIVMKQSWKRRKNILFLSRVHVKKGINFLIEAVGKVNGNVNLNETLRYETRSYETLRYETRSYENQDENENEKQDLKGYMVTVAGSGDEGYVRELKEMTERLGVADMFRFVGSVYGEDKWRLYQEADVFVLPTHSENFGIVVAEALASGTPVITTTGTPWEELNTEHCGWWVPVGTEPLVEALQAFLQTDEEELKQMGENGRRLIEKKYSATTIAEQFVSLYEMLTARNADATKHCVTKREATKTKTKTKRGTGTFFASKASKLERTLTITKTKTLSQVSHSLTLRSSSNFF